MDKVLFTSESVTEGHPDKICDQISDAILDALLEQDPMSRVACETCTTTGIVMVMGEISTKAYVDIQKIVRDTVREIGYTRGKYGFDADTCGVITTIDEQSSDIAMGVDKALEAKENNMTDEEIDAIGAGDQGMMFGFATNETEEYMPYPISLAHKLSRQLTKVRKDGTLSYLRPDGKTQVTVEYDDGKPSRLDAVVLSTQHDPDITQEQIHEDIKREVFDKILPADMVDDETKFFINPTGRFVIGGPHGDAGLTGRKIIVDTYGGYARHGGGACLLYTSSIGAFNALLKTLEEPPEYVIFILATTEVHKIPITILSRCQRYDFHRITAATIKKQLSDLMEQEHVDTEDKALEYVARMADGSMRDALSLLDQCIAFYLGEKLTYDNVLEVLGTVDIQVYSDLLDMILSQDINGVMDLLEDVARQGREWSQFITDFLWYLRNLLLVGQGNAAEEALEVSTDQLKLLQEKAQQVEENTLIRYIRILSELLERIRYATSKRVLVEVEMMKMCRPQMEADTNSLADRVRQLEQQLEQLLQSGIPVQQAAQAGQNQIALQQEVKSEQDPVKQLNEKFPPAKVEELIELVNHWRDVKRNLSPQMKYCLQRATLSVNEEGTALRVLFPKEMNVESGYFLEEPERIEQLKQELSRQSGRDVELEVSVMNTDNDDSDMINLDCIHMDVKIED